MTLKKCSLLEVAALASASLEEAGIRVAVVGGSAITAHVPHVYTSHDVDFAAINGTTRRAFGKALARLGFRARGRDFVHSETRVSLDLVADTPFVDQRPITQFTTVKTRFGAVRVLRFEDAIADRVAAFLHWSDAQSLEVADRALAARAHDISWRRIEQALDALDSSGSQETARLAIAKRRLKAAHRRSSRKEQT